MASIESSPPVTKPTLVIPAAGLGTRSGLPYPKTLYRVNGQPILHRLIQSFSPHVSEILIVVSPHGLNPIRSSLQSFPDLSFSFVIQPEPLGMGHAVLLALNTLDASNAPPTTLLSWSDLAFLSEETITRTLDYYLQSSCDLAFPTIHVNNPYTVVKRDTNNHFIDIIETKESTLPPPPFGERDIGFFVFNRVKMQQTLTCDNHGKYSSESGEHGFLYALKHLTRVHALPIALPNETKSLNKISDLQLDPLADL